MKQYSLLLLVSVLLMSTGAAYAQIELEAAFPGTATSGYIAPVGTGKLDFSGDGALDPSFIKTDSQGNVALVIQDGADPTISTVVDLITLLGLPGRVMGYFELDRAHFINWEEKMPKTACSNLDFTKFSPVATGLYYYKLSTDGFTMTRKMLLLK